MTDIVTTWRVEQAAVPQAVAVQVQMQAVLVRRLLLAVALRLLEVQALRTITGFPRVAPLIMAFLVLTVLVELVTMLVAAEVADTMAEVVGPMMAEVVDPVGLLRQAPLFPTPVACRVGTVN